MISPTLIEIFGFEIKWYSVLVLAGVIFAYLLIRIEMAQIEIIFSIIYLGLALTSLNICPKYSLIIPKQNI